MKATFVTMSKYHHPLPFNINVGRQSQAGINTQAETCLYAQRNGLRFLENSSHATACMLPRPQNLQDLIVLAGVGPPPP